MKETGRDKIPDSPGIYIFTGKTGDFLYVGKAANLRKRTASHFKSGNPRMQAMVKSAASLKYIRTDSEIEALILESQYIKKYKPKFNVSMRDDKQYFYVEITGDDFPKIFLGHQKKAKAEHIGPFTDGGALRTTLKFLRKIFPYCTCKQKHANFCLNYHLDNCPGYCCLKETKNKEEKQKEYKKNIEAVKKILEGKKNVLVQKLNKEMAGAAKKENFEKSIELRNQIAKLERVFSNAKIIREMEKSEIAKKIKRTFRLKKNPRRIEGYDISNIYGQFAAASMIVFTNGEADKKEYRKFKIRISGKPDDTAMIKETVSRRINRSEWTLPDLILIDGGKGQLNAVLSVLKKEGLNIPTIALAKDEKHKGSHVYASTLKEGITLQKIDKEVGNLIVQMDAEAHRFAIAYYRKLHKRRLGEKSLSIHSLKKKD